MLPIRTILHPTDFSDCSEYAFRMACSLCRHYGARLVVVHVAPQDIVYAGLIGGTIPGAPHLEACEEQLRESFAKEVETPVEVHVKEGDPASTILELADEVHADLIVMGTTGRTGLARILLGSVAEEVLRHARCPVLTVKGPVEKEVPQPSSLVGAEA